MGIKDTVIRLFVIGECTVEFSVLMSIYTKESPEFLRQALNSLKAQTLSADEIVIVKDGSITSELEAILTEYSLTLPLKVVGYEQNRGLGYALAFGLQHCRYDWVARMDSDDIADKFRFEKQINFITEHPALSVVGGQIQEFSESITEVMKSRRVPLDHDDIVRFLKKRNAINHVTVFFKKKDVLNAGNYEDVPGFEDYYLWVRMILNGCKVANIPENLVAVRVGNDMIGRRIGFRYAKEEYRFYKKLRKLKFLSCTEFIKVVCMRIPLRLVPKPVLAFIYKKLLRK